jgi:hypothetical protein
MMISEASLLLSDGEAFDVFLVHKTCPFVMISSKRLEDFDAKAQIQVARVGQSFWNYCKTTYLGRNTTTPQETK